MAINIPGLSLSILRQQTSVQAGLPLLISGRFTAFGMGMPALIRVFLEGPSYDPQIRSFDTFASPFSGDYTTNVIAEKDGQYNVYAQAFMPPLIPSGPPFPEAIMLLPPFAESTRPPLVVGFPFNGGVEALLPDGTRERLTSPDMLDIEITPIITIGAPAITFPPGVPPMIPYVPPPAPPPAPSPPYVPPYVPPAPPPVEPEVPMIDILGTPSLVDLPRQLNVGDVWSGSVSLPTFGISQLFAQAQLVLRDPQGYERIVSPPVGRTLQPGETLQIPVNFNTTGFPGGDHTIFLRVFDQFGQLIIEFPMGFLSMIEAIAPPFPVPPEPEIPTTPTADMFDTPIVYLLTELEIGQMWQGDVTIPTMVPPALLQLPSLPALPVNIGLQLQDPAGQLFNVATFPQQTFTPGQDITLPVNFDTSVLTQEGMHDLIMNITDLQGNTLFPPPGTSGIIGFLQALMPAIPLPKLPEFSRFTAIDVEMTPQTVNVGQSITIPFSYTHVGGAERVIFYAAIGDIRPAYLGGFDQVWQEQKAVNVDAHAVPTTIRDSIQIQITEKFLGPGSYAVFAKVTGRIPEVESAHLPNMVEVVAPDVIPRADIRRYDFQMLTVGIFNPGDILSWKADGEYKGRAQAGTLTISLGLGSFAPLISLVVLPSTPVSFEPSTDWAPFSFRGNFIIPANVKLGITYSIKARLETFMDPTQETDHDFNVIKIEEPPPTPPSPPPPAPPADIANYDFQILTVGPFNPEDTVSWRADGVYRGMAQSGSLSIALGTGSFAPIITKFTLPAVPVSFEPSTDWAPFSFRGNFVLPSGVKPGLIYSIRAKMQTFVDPTQETDHDFNSISIAPAPPGYTLIAEPIPPGYGSIAFSPPTEAPISPGVYAPGTQINLTARPGSEKRFDYWSGDASGTAPTITVTMDRDKSVTAHFNRVTAPPPEPPAPPEPAPPAPPAPPPPALPRADIADYDFEVTSTGPYTMGDTVTWMASCLYKGRRQAGRITISLGTGPVGTFFTKHTFPARTFPAGIFPEAYDWTDIFISGSFVLPATLELDQTYSIRARFEATEEPAQETDTDYGIITIAEAPPPEQYTLTVGQEPIAGSVTINPDKDFYNRAEVVVLRAFPPTGFEFDYWDINDSRRAYNPASVIMMRDSVAIVHYVPVP